MPNDIRKINYFFDICTEFHCILKFKMHKHKTLYHYLITFTLLLVLMLPSGIKILHALDDHHDHTEIAETSTQINIESHDCDICEFQFVSFNIERFYYPDFFKASIPLKSEDQIVSNFLLSINLNNTQLRAPPHFLIS